MDNNQEDKYGDINSFIISTIPIESIIPATIPRWFMF